MKKLKNKWKRLQYVQCGTCDYCCCFEGDNEWFCIHREKAYVTGALDISRKRMCKYYFPREVTNEEVRQKAFNIVKGESKEDDERRGIEESS